MDILSDFVVDRDHLVDAGCTLFGARAETVELVSDVAKEAVRHLGCLCDLFDG